MTIVLSLLLLLAVVFPAYANPACAVCTIAVGASLEIARSLGVDDSVVGVWLAFGPSNGLIKKAGTSKAATGRLLPFPLP